MFRFKKMLGVGLSSAVMVAVAAVATPASADGPNENSVCVSIQNSITQNAIDVANASAALTTATTNVTSRKAQLDAATAELVLRVVNYVNALDSGSNITLSKTLLDNALAAFNIAAINWVSAVDGRDAANLNFVVLSDLVDDILNGIDSGLGCP